MTATQLFLKKYRQRWTDTEVIVLMLLADLHLANLTELTSSAGMPASTGHNALTALVTRGMLMVHDIPCGKYYSLTSEGRLAIRNLLK